MKSNSVFALESAVWPAVLLDDTGVIRHANAAAVAAFGAIVESQPTLASSIWPAESDQSPQQFLVHLDRSSSGMMPLRLRGKGGKTQEFQCFACSTTVEGRKSFTLQLFNPDQLPTSPGKPGELGSEASRPEVAAVDASIAQKQKLDCALQLARTVASDFNNALTSILGHTSLLLSRIDLSHPWRSSLVEVEKSAEKAAEIANDLAAFSRQEKDTGTQKPGNLNGVLRRTVEMFQTPWQTKIKWSLHLEERLYAAVFDEAKIQQAIVKILDNALQAVGESGTIGIRSRNHDVVEPQQDETVTLQPGSYVCVEIDDTGGGIPIDLMPRIFEPFFTTKGQPHRGLGLAWVYGIVTNHGGSVAISSPPMMGTSVRIYLPAQRKYVRDHNVKSDDFGGTETILMVDDEDLLLTMGQTVLSAYGYRVLTANSGQKALEIFTQDPTGIDLVITDLVMPHMSGRELIEQLRRITPEVHVICSSGYVRTPGLVEDEVYLQKPFTTQELLRRVKQVLAMENEPT